MGYSPWCRKELETTEGLNNHGVCASIAPVVLHRAHVDGASTLPQTLCKAPVKPH